MRRSKCDVCHKWEDLERLDSGLMVCPQCKKSYVKRGYHIMPALRLGLSQEVKIRIRILARENERPMNWIAEKALERGLELLELDLGPRYKGGGHETA